MLCTSALLAESCSGLRAFLEAGKVGGCNFKGAFVPQHSLRGYCRSVRLCKPVQGFLYARVLVTVLTVTRITAPGGRGRVRPFKSGMKQR